MAQKKNNLSSEKPEYIQKWEEQVRACVENKGDLSKLFRSRTHVWYWDNHPGTSAFNNTPPIENDEGPLVDDLGRYVSTRKSILVTGTGGQLGTISHLVDIIKDKSLDREGILKVVGDNLPNSKQRLGVSNLANFLADNQNSLHKLSYHSDSPGFWGAFFDNLSYLDTPSYGLSKPSMLITTGNLRDNYTESFTINSRSRLEEIGKEFNVPVVYIGVESEVPA